MLSLSSRLGTPSGQAPGKRNSNEWPKILPRSFLVGTD